MERAIVLAAEAIGIGIAMFTGIGPALGEGYAVAKALEAIGRQPEAASKITTNMILGCALAETTGIYALVVSLIILFANPLIKML